MFLIGHAQVAARFAPLADPDTAGLTDAVPVRCADPSYQLWHDLQSRKPIFNRWRTGSQFGLFSFARVCYPNFTFP